jgi:hypothetical protein
MTLRSSRDMSARRMVSVVGPASTSAANRIAGHGPQRPFAFSHSRYG